MSCIIRIKNISALEDVDDEVEIDDLSDVRNAYKRKKKTHEKAAHESKPGLLYGSKQSD